MYKKRVIIFFFPIVILFFLLGLLLSFLYYKDPLYILYKGKKLDITTPSLLYPNIRLQAKGIINRYDFDSVIIGSSMLQNTSALYASEKLHSKFINLSLSGSAIPERLVILKYLLSSREIKKVIISLDFFSFEQNHMNLSLLEIGIPSWDYLYDENKLYQLKLYMTTDFFKQFILQKDDKRILISPEKYNFWNNDKKNLFFGGIDNWIKYINVNPEIKQFLLQDLPNKAKKIDNSFEKKSITINWKVTLDQYIEKFLLEMIKNNSKTEFYLIFPPYWRYTYAEWKQVDGLKFEQYKHIISKITQKLSSYENVFIYGFDTENFVDYIENYMDTGHYHPQINQKMIDSIAENSNKITKENVDNYIEEIDMLANQFDIKKLANEVEEKIKKMGNK